MGSGGVMFCIVALIILLLVIAGTVLDIYFVNQEKESKEDGSNY